MRIVLLSACGLLLGLTACQGFVAGTAARTGVAVAEERRIGGVVDDNEIFISIEHLYIQHDSNNLVSDIDVDVHDGRVLLTGKTAKQETALEAVRLAWMAAGVKEVINEIVITDHGTPMTYANDSWIETAIKARMLGTKNIMSINYTVEVVNGVAYLLGIAQDQGELERAAKVASRIKGVKKVISYVRVKESRAVPSENPSY